MADEILDQIREVVEGQIDFEGQRIAELLATSLLSAVGVLSFVVGYVLQDVKLAVYIALAGSALTFVIVVPPWPFFNKHPLRWAVPGAPSGKSTLRYESSATKQG